MPLGADALGMEILVTMPATEVREDFFPPRLRDRLESFGSVTWTDDSDPDEAALRESIPGVDVLVTGWGSPTVTPEVVDGADHLGLVAHTGGSVANLVTEAVYDAGIDVVSANGVMAIYTAEHALTTMLSRLRRVPDFAAGMESGGWGQDVTDVRSLVDADVGLVGLGTIGRRLLDHLRSFDATVSVYDPYVDESALADYPDAELASLDAALDSAVVSLHAARTPETVGMLDADRLAQIPDGALFVNTARAELVVEEALMAELRSGRFDAVLDVYHEEPLPADHELRELDNVVLTPHVGGSRIREPLTEAIIDELARFEDDDPLDHAIGREQWRLMTR
jgi:phosphoglycerate dehydrogenase-like enzyme